MGCRGWGDHLVDAGKSIVDVVDTFVIVSGAQVFETLVTDSTVVGSLPCVHSHVDSKVILLAKFPSTLIALKQIIIKTFARKSKVLKPGMAFLLYEFFHAKSWQYCH